MSLAVSVPRGAIAYLQNEKTGTSRSHEYRNSLIRTDSVDFVIARYSTFKGNPELKRKVSGKFTTYPTSEIHKFGCGKGIFTYVADDFDTTPPGFEEYMLS